MDLLIFWKNRSNPKVALERAMGVCNVVGFASFVAQISNLLYRRASSLRIGCALQIGRPADWKSAIQQVGNLRYFPRARRPTQESEMHPSSHCAPSHFAPRPSNFPLLLASLSLGASSEVL